MTDTVTVPRETDREPASRPLVDERLADELLGRAQAEGVELLGPGGLLSQVTKAVLERALGEELTHHLGYEKHDPAGRGSGNARNGSTGKDSGFGRFPSRQFAINAAWLELALVGIDLLAWTRVLLLDSTHALAEPKKLRYRLLHVAARIVRTARRVYLRIAQTWPWANELATAYARLVALPRPAG